MSEAVSTRTLEQVTQEIRYLDSQAKRLVLGHAIEIGRRLTEAKALVPYGEWGEYIERELEYSQSTAQNFMRIFEEFGAAQQSLFGPVAESQTLGNLSYTKALKLLAVPREEREEFAAAVDAEHLSTRELEAAIRERDEARKRAEDAEARERETRDELSETAEMLDKTIEERNARGVIIREHEEQLQELEKQLEELRSRPVEVAVHEPDPAEVEKRAAELAQKAKAEAEKQAKAEIAAAKKDAKAAAKAAEEERKLIQDKLEVTQAKLQELMKKQAEIADAKTSAIYQEEIDRLRKQLAMSGEAVTTFRLRFAAWQEAYRAMREAMENVPEDSREKLRAAVLAQAKAWTEA